MIPRMEEGKKYEVRPIREGRNLSSTKWYPVIKFDLYERQGFEIRDDVGFQGFHLVYSCSFLGSHYPEELCYEIREIKDVSSEG